MYDDSVRFQNIVLYQIARHLLPLIPRQFDNIDAIFPFPSSSAAQFGLDVFYKFGHYVVVQSFHDRNVFLRRSLLNAKVDDGGSWLVQQRKVLRRRPNRELVVVGQIAT